MQIRDKVRNRRKVEKEREKEVDSLTLNRAEK